MQDFISQKQNNYYLNLFHESIYFRIHDGFPHPGLNVSPQLFQSGVFFKYRNLQQTYPFHKLFLKFTVYVLLE
jgi:hypothetical protein